MNSFSNENLKLTLNSFAFYNFTTYVLSFFPLLFEDAVFITYQRSLDITFETCSGLYLFNSSIEGKFFERLNKYAITIKEQNKENNNVFLNTLNQIFLFVCFTCSKIIYFG